LIQKLGPHKGKLIVVTGPMYACKSKTTKEIYDKYCLSIMRPVPKGIWIKPSTDSRNPDATTTHDNKIVANAHTISAESPLDALEHIQDYDVIVFDEAQFYSEQIVDLISALLQERRIIIVNGLKLTANGSIFGAMHYLLAYADEIISLKAVCNRCWNVDSATRTRAFDRNNPTVKVGGAEDYFVTCPECEAR